MLRKKVNHHILTSSNKSTFRFDSAMDKDFVPFSLVQTI